MFLFKKSDSSEKVVEALARLGGAHLLKRRHEMVVGFKGGDRRDVVTNIDIEVEKKIRDEISRQYPDHGYYSEESGELSSGKEFMWSIDPIDGTSNFARDIPHYACCVSLFKDNKVIAAAIYNPITEECFTLSEGQPHLNGQKILVSDARHLKDSYVIFHPGRKREMRTWAGESLKRLLKNAKKNLNFAASALDLCFLASGRVDVVVYGTLTTLDVAGAIAIVRAAGGEVYSYETTEPVNFSDKPQRIIATATPALLEDFFMQR